MSRFALCFILFLLVGCDMNRHADESMERTPINKTASTTKTGILVEKNFVNKKGEVLDIKELYFRASIQDYYIKFCESEVSRADLIPFIDTAISIEGEILEGLWDDCGETEEEVQSRTGLYIIITKLIN